MYAREAEEALSVICRFAVAQLMKVILFEADDLRKLVPQYAHIVDDKKFGKTSARKYLLVISGRDTLNMKSQTTHKWMKETGRLHEL